VIDAIEINLVRLQKILNRLAWKARVMLLAAEALFLNRRKCAAVVNKGRRAIVVEGRRAAKQSLRAVTGFDTDDARLKIGKEAQNFTSPHPST